MKELIKLIEQHGIQVHFLPNEEPNTIRLHVTNGKHQMNNVLETHMVKLVADHVAESMIIGVVNEFIDEHPKD